MRHAVLAISLFLVTTVISTVSWVVSTSELALDFIPSTPAKSQDVASNNTAFIEQIKASLSKDVPEPPTEQNRLLQNASLSTGVSNPPVANRGLLVKASYNGSYGVNEESIKRACSDLAQRSP